MKIFKEIVIALVIIIVGAIVLKVATIGYSNKEVIAIEIKDKYIKKDNKSDVYMIVDTDNNTYQISDLFWIGKFDSTDLYNKLEIGQAYLVEITGVRNQFLSWYPNINKIL